MVKRSLSLGLCLATLVIAGPTLTGCHGAPQPKVAQVRSDSMPSGASWDGVYFNPLFGKLHLLEKSGRLHGRWMRPQKDRWGELEGSIDGDVVHFEWKELVTDGFGPNAKKSGKGYFKYTRPSGENVDDLLEGAMGLGENELGTPWKCVKQRNEEPDLDGVQPGARSDGSSEDWDGTGPRKEPAKSAPEPAPKAEPEEPATPEPETPKPTKSKGKGKAPKGG